MREPFRRLSRVGVPKIVFYFRAVPACQFRAVEQAEIVVSLPAAPSKPTRTRPYEQC